MDATVREKLEELRDEMCADSLTEVIRRSLAVYDLLWNESSKGTRVYLRRQGEQERELLLA